MSPEQIEFKKVIRYKRILTILKYVLCTVTSFILFIRLIFADKMNNMILIESILFFAFIYSIWSLYEIIILFKLRKLNNSFSIDTKEKIVKKILEEMDFKNDYINFGTFKSDLGLIIYKRENKLYYYKKCVYIYINEESIYITCFSKNTWRWGTYPSFTDSRIRRKIIKEFKSEVKTIHNKNSR